MGVAAALFFTMDQAENCLAYRIRPSDEQREAQTARWNDLRDALIDDLGEKSGYSISSWLQGSYKFGTQVRPSSKSEEFDIDLGIYFRWVGSRDEGVFGPLELKEIVQRALIDYAADENNEATGVGKPKERCNRIHFSSDFHIDVPIYHLDPERDLRSLATNKDIWEDSDPKKIYVWWKEAIDEASRPRARRLVRYLKMWSALNIAADRRPSSILITVLATEAFLGLDQNSLSGDDEYLEELAKRIKMRLEDDAIVPNPIDESENLNRLSQASTEQLVDSLGTLLSIAGRALDALTKEDSADIWSEAFYHFFPMPEPEVILEDARRGAIVVQLFDPQIAVTATTESRKFAGLNSIGPIPKGCALRFELSNASQLPGGSEVSWTVRNAGSEAEAENDLGHRRQNGLYAEESSAYRGKHFMDVTVRLNGRIIGRKRVPVEVSGLGMPMRNPKRPAWVQLRSGWSLHIRRHLDPEFPAVYPNPRRFHYAYGSHIEIICFSYRARFRRDLTPLAC